MTTTPRPSFGQALGTAARKINKLHRHALAECNTDFPSWMLFSLLKEKDAPIPIDNIVAELNNRMDLDKAGVLSTLERAASAGYISYSGATAELSSAGSTHFATVYTHARAITDAATAGIPQDQLEIATTTLLEVNAIATPLLQGRQQS